MWQLNRFFLLIILLSAGLTASAQSDSLLSVFKVQTGIDKLQTAIAYGSKHYYSNPEKTISVCSSVTDIAQKLDSSLLLGKCYNIIALSHWSTGGLDSATLFFKQALTAAKLAKDIHFESKTVSNIARLYTAKTVYDTALEYSLQALHLQESLNDSVAMSSTLASIGKIYIYLNELPTALDYQNQARELLNEFDHAAQIGKIDNTIGYIYDELGQYDSAVQYYNQSVKFKTMVSDQIGLLYTTTNMCVALRNLKKDAEALQCNQDALRLSRQLNAPEVEAINLLNIGINLSDLSEFSKSVTYLDSAVVLLQAQQDMRNLREAEGMYWFNYEKLGDYKNAFIHHKKYKALADSILNIDKVSAVEELRTQYESDKKEAENILLQAKNDADALKIQQKTNTITGLIIGSILLIGIILLLFNRNRLKQIAIHARKEVESQTAITLAEIESRENERKRIARELHDGIGQQLTAINFAWETAKSKAKKDDKLSDLIQRASQDVRTISHQMMPKSLTSLGLDNALKELVDQLPSSESVKVTYASFGDPFELPENVTINVYRIVQECLNNAIKHSGASQIDVITTHMHDDLVFTVEDNGKGFDHEQVSGHGLTNLANRSKIIHGDLSIESGDTGTTCRLRLLANPFPDTP